MTNDIYANFHTYATQKDTHAPGVSWAAIWAGVAAAVALSLFLCLLGTGLGLVGMSPWDNDDTTAKTFSMAVAAWIILTQLLASGVGGYLTGRLRIKWINTHDYEINFRDIAHGFLTWAIATIIAAIFFSVGIHSMIGNGIKAVTAAESQMTKSNHSNNSLSYFIEKLFRSNTAPNPTATDIRGIHQEASTIFITNLNSNNLPDEDVRYLAHIVAQQSAISEDEAANRVRDIFSNIKKAAANAHRIAAHCALWLSMAMVLGAFFAGLGAVWGGKKRDQDMSLNQSL